MIRVAWGRKRKLNLHSGFDGDDHVGCECGCGAGILEHVVEVGEPGFLLHAVEEVTPVADVVDFKAHVVTQLWYIISKLAA